MMQWWSTLSWSFALLLLATAATLALWALFRDRPRGRKRCPRCWYDLSSLIKPGTLPTCPECGHAPKSARQLNRTHRRWGWTALATLPFAGGVWFAIWPTVNTHGWLAAVPTPVLLHLAFSRDVNSQSPLYSELVYSRFPQDRFWPGVRRWSVGHTLNQLQQAPEPQHRELAGSLLAWVGGHDSRITPALIDAAKHDPDSDVRRRAVVSLGIYLADAKRAIPALVSLLESDPAPDVRIAVLATLARYGPAAEPAAPAIFEALHDSDSEVRMAATAAAWLPGIDRKRVLPYLLEMLDDAQDARARDAIVVALGLLGADAATAVPHLADLLEDDPFSFTALRSLAMIGSAAAPLRPAIAALANNPDAHSGIHYMAEVALSIINDQHADIVRVHAATIADPQNPARRTAAAELRRLAYWHIHFPEDVVHTLIDTMLNDDDWTLTFALSGILSSLPGAHAEPILSSLRRYARAHGYTFALDNVTRLETRLTPEKPEPSPAH